MKLRRCIVKIPIRFDRDVARGSLRKLLWTAFLILLLPLCLFYCYHVFEWLLSFESPFCQVEALMGAYESYLNPNFNADAPNVERGYTLLIAYIGAFLLSGFLISLAVAYFQSRQERWERGDLHYPCVLPHVVYDVIIGGNEMVPNLVKQILAHQSAKHASPDLVLIMTNRDVPALRKALTSTLGKDEKKVVIYYGERTSKDDLQHLLLHHAQEIYVIGEQLDIEQKGSHHDVKNMACVQLMAELLEKSEAKRKPLCRVMYEYQSSFSAFQFTDVDDRISRVMDFRPFNYYEMWAQNVFVCTNLQVGDDVRYLPLEGKEPITPESETTVHLIIAGMSRMGIAMGIEAAHLAHYPNFVQQKGKELRTRITFIDSVAKKEMRYFQGHYKELFAVSRWRYMEASEDAIYYSRSAHLPYDSHDGTWNAPLTDKDSHSPYRDDAATGYTLGTDFVDVDWEFIQGDLEMPAVQNYIREATKQGNVKVTIAICFARDNASFAASLYLPDEVYNDNNNVVQVLAYQPYGDAMCKGFKSQLNVVGAPGGEPRSKFNQFAKLKGFGMMSSCYDIQRQLYMENAAEQLWEQYDRTYKSRVGGRNDLRGMLGLKMIKAGKSLAAKQWSNTYAAAHLWTKLRSIGWDDEVDRIPNEKLGVMAKLEHIRWNMEQLLLGFAPLRPEEQCKLVELYTTAQSATKPENAIKHFQEDKAKADIYPNKDHYIGIKAWLEKWDAFDQEREFLKASMSHIDICSFERLKEIDRENMQYDVDLTAILPYIYKKLNGMKCNDEELHLPEAAIEEIIKF